MNALTMVSADAPRGASARSLRLVPIVPPPCIRLGQDSVEMNIIRLTIKRKAMASLSAGTLLFCAATSVGPAQAPTAAAPRELTVSVVESLARGPGRITDFDRLRMVFTDVFEHRKWPVKIKVERFAANTPTSDIELRVFYQGIYEEAPGDLTFHAWMTLYDRGVKHDFGIVRYRYNPRPLQQEDDVLERVVRGAADVAASKIEAALFPKAEGPKH